MNRHPRHIFIAFFVTLLLVISGCGTSNVDQPDTGDENAEETTEETADTAPDESKEEIEDEQTEDEESEDTAENGGESKTDKNDNLQDLTVHYIDVGQADATLFEYADGDESYTLLFDTGDWTRNDVVSYLDSEGISSIDLVVISHPHSDHIGQLAEIMRRYDVGEVWMSGNEATSNTFQEAIQAVLDSDADYEEPRMGDEYSIGPMDITVLYPDHISRDLNEESVSLLMSYGDIDLMFTGDAEKGAESAMVRSDMTLDADILQLGHHGSRTSSTLEFIQAVNPEVAIYSAGVDNQYDHPSAEVVERIQDAGIDLYGTDVHGTVILTTDGSTYDIQTKEDGTISPKSTGSTSKKTSDSNKKKEENKSKEENNTSNCVDINSASIEQVQEIIHIGSARAQDLIDLRPFDSVDDLSRISGIGPARIADIKEQGTACAK